MFYLDEARDYIPAGAAKPPAKMPLIRLFTQGRKYGVACLICTQSPRSVDYNVFGNCSTKIVGRLGERPGRRARGRVVRPERPGAGLAEDAGRAPTPGTFVARWPGMPAELEGRTFKSRALFSLHEGAWSPERWGGRCATTPFAGRPTPAEEIDVTTLITARPATGADADDMDNFPDAVCATNPFTDNRVNGLSADGVDVDDIHRVQFERLTALARRGVRRCAAASGPCCGARRASARVTCWPA